MARILVVEGREFGAESVMAAMSHHIEGTAEEMRNAFPAELTEHGRGVVQADDITLIAAHVLGERGQ